MENSADMHSVIEWSSYIGPRVIAVLAASANAARASSHTIYCFYIYEVVLCKARILQ